MISFKTFIVERVLNIGLKPEHEPHREKHRAEIHDILHHSYKTIGGYGGHESGSAEEHHAIHHDISHSLIKAHKRDGKITSVNLYRKQHGRKSIASGSNGTEQGKRDFLKNKMDDHKQKRAWGEVSGAVEKIAQKHGVPTVPAHKAAKLTGKTIDHVHPDGQHYDRKIGGHTKTKVIVGHPKEDE